MKDQKLVIGLGIVVLLAALGLYFLIFNKQAPKEETRSVVQEEAIPKISASELGLTFELREDKRAAKFIIANAKDITSVEYEMSYTKDVDGEKLPETLIGDAKPEGGKIETDYRIFGTCSSGVCRYDKVVSQVKLTLKITKKGNEVYQAEASTDL